MRYRDFRVGGSLGPKILETRVAFNLTTFPSCQPFRLPCHHLDPKW